MRAHRINCKLILLILGAASALAGASIVANAQLPPSPDVVTAEPRNLENYVPTAEQLQSIRARGRSRLGRGGEVYQESIDPHWLPDGSRFWYRNDYRDDAKQFILVDGKQGTRAPAFDHRQLADALSKVTDSSVAANQLPFEVIDFDDSGKSLLFSATGGRWRCDLATYELTRIGDAAAQVDQPPNGRGRGRWGRRNRNPRFEEITPETVADGTNLAHDPPLYEDSQSPDGKWTACIVDQNILLRGADGQTVKLSEIGTKGQSFGMLSWSPNSQKLVASRIVEADYKEVYLIESTPEDGGRARLHRRLYPLPGDTYTTYELWVFDVENRQGSKVDADIIDFYGPAKIRWRDDGRHFLYHQTDRGHGRFRIYEVDARTGQSRLLMDDNPETFVNTTYDSFIYYTEPVDEIIYASERDGWKHLYLIDVDSGELLPITSGEWVVRGVDRIDEQSRQIWFRASGVNKDEDPYFIHHFRVDFDGSDLVALTAGNGTHTVQYSPDRHYLIDTYSRVDLPPVHVLRRASDGSEVCELERADTSDLTAAGWKPPEVFVAKGRDGQTDIWGVMERPRDMDPTKRYPVIESIYAGPHSSYVPKAFAGRSRWSSLTDLGFIVVQMDGMGTANRSKAFHDVCWHDLADAGFPDRILWHRAVAEKYPYYDINRVGVYGGSAGGQNSVGALLFHPEFYKVAVSACGCHDNRLDKASWNEQWMGYPVGEHYAASSNIENAHRLEGKLMLILGELDTNVPPESTYRLIDALNRAGKNFEFVFVPGAGHGSGGAYGAQRRLDFFVRHLHGVDTPDWNQPTPKTAATQ